MANPVLTRQLNNETSYEVSPAGIEIPHVGGARMTLEGTINRTISLFGLLAISAAFTWVFNLAFLALPAALIGFGLAMWATFSKTVRPAVMMAYAVVEGVFIGGISLIFETIYPGIVMQAVTATLATAGVIFVAYKQKWVRVSNKTRKMFMFALMGYMAFGLINFGVAMFTGNSAYNTSFGWMIALVGVGLASFTLVIDLNDVESAIRNGAPVENEWRAAFGLMVTMVWMYIEILRLLAILRGDD